MKPDGTVVIDTKLNTNGLEAGSHDAEQEIRRMAQAIQDLSTTSKIALQRQVNQFVKLNSAYAQNEKKLKQLEEEMALYGETKIPTQEYSNAEKEIQKISQALDRAIERQIKFYETGGNIKSRAFAGMEYDIERLSRQLDEANERKKQLVSSGKAFTLGKDTDKFSQMSVRYEKESQKLANTSAILGTTFAKVEDELNKYKERLRGIDNSQKKAQKSGKKFNNELRSTGKNAKKAQYSIGRMLATSILFSTVFRAISMVTAGLKEGMDNLAQYSDDTNQALSILMSALTQLKNAFATAFSPLIEFVAPALAQFINLLSQAVTWTAQLLAALTGKDTFVKAVKVQQDYADSLDKTKDETEEAADATEKSLAPFDQLIQLTHKKKDKDKNELKPEDMFKTEVVSNEIKAQVDAIKDTMDSIKSRLLEMKDIFASGFWEGLGDYKPILNEISKDFQSIKDHLKSIFTDAEVMESANRMVNAFVDMAGKMAGAMVSVGLTIAANLIGGFESYLSNNTERIKEWLITVFDVTSEIYTLWGDFFVAFADVFSVFASQTAQDITGLIIQIFSDLFMGFTELVAKFTRDVTNLFLSPFIENKDRIKTAIENTLNPIKTIIEGIASVVRNVVDGVIALYDTHIHPLIMTLKDEVSNFLGILLDGYNSYIAPVLDKVAQKFKEVMEGKVGDAINSALRFIGKLVDFIRLCWEQVVFPIINWIAEKMFPLISPVLEAIGNVVIDVLGTIADVIGSVFDVLSGLIDFITGVFTGNWEAAWQGVKDIFAGIWDGIVSVIEGAVKIIEGIIDGIKGTIDAVFGTDFSDSDSISGRTRKYEAYPASVYAAVPYKMPRLATGTVVPPRAGEFAAILGDNKREAEVVSPLSTMKQAFKEALFESGIGAGERDINIELVLDGQRFARAVYKANNQEKQRVGVRMVTNG